MSAATDTPACTNRHPRPVVFEVRSSPAVRFASGLDEARQTAVWASSD